MFSGVTVTSCAVMTIMCLVITAAAPTSHTARRHRIAESPHHNEPNNLRSRINDWKRSGIEHLLLDVSRKSRSHISQSDVVALNKFVRASEGILKDISKYSGPHATEMSEVRSSMLEKIKMIDGKLKSKRANNTDSAASANTTTATTTPVVALSKNKTIDKLNRSNEPKRDDATAPPSAVKNQASPALEEILQKFKKLEERAESREKAAERKHNDEPIQPVDDAQRADMGIAPNVQPNPQDDSFADSLLTGGQDMAPMQSPMQSPMMQLPSMDNNDLRSGSAYSNQIDQSVAKQFGAPQDPSLEQLGNGLVEGNGGQLGYMDGLSDQIQGGQGGQGMAAALGAAPAMPAMQGFGGQGQDGLAAADPYSWNNGQQRGGADISAPTMEEFDRGGEAEDMEPRHHHRHHHHHHNRHHQDDAWDNAEADASQYLQNNEEFQQAGGDALSSDQFAGAGVPQVSPFAGRQPFEAQMDPRCANWAANGRKRGSIPGLNCESGGMAGMSLDEGRQGNGPRVGMMSRGGGFVASNPNVGLGAIANRLITPQAMPLISPSNSVMYNPTQRMQRMNPRVPFQRPNMMLPQMQQPPILGDQPQPGVFAGMRIDPADKLLADLQAKQMSSNNMESMIGDHQGFDHLHGRMLNADYGPQNFANNMGQNPGFGYGRMPPSGMLNGGFRKRNGVHGRHSPQNDGMFSFKKSTVAKQKKTSTDHKAKKKHVKKKTRSTKGKSIA